MQAVGAARRAERRAHLALDRRDVRRAQAQRRAEVVPRIVIMPIGVEPCLGQLKPDVARADDDRGTRPRLLEVAKQTPPVAQVSQHEDACEVAARERRADGGRAGRQHQRLVTDRALALGFAHAHDRLRGEQLDGLAVESDFDGVSLAEVFGRVEDERVGRVDEPRDDVREAAGAVRDVGRALEDGDGQVGRVAPRLHRRREPGRDAPDDDQSFLIQERRRKIYAGWESTCSLIESNVEGKSPRRGFRRASP